MNRAGLAALAAGAFVGGLYLARRAADRAADASAASDRGDGSTALDFINPWGAIERQYEQHATEQAMSAPNIAAFLSMIAYAEGTDREPDPYAVCYGYRHRVRDFADHPAVTGEWEGERLPDDMCRAAGFGPGCVSTAAGRYQITKPTWLRAKRALSLGDFSPESQDAAAVWLIRQRGALDHVEAGRIGEAVALVRQEWASLPGAGWGQPERRLTALLDAYTSAGGYVA